MVYGVNMLIITPLGLYLRQQNIVQLEEYRNNVSVTEYEKNKTTRRHEEGMDSSC